MVKIGRDFGISGRLFLHIQSFFTNRFARLKIDKCFGDCIESIIGTTAGTRLGPLLFIMYLHDVPRSITPKYADDLVVVGIGEDMQCVVGKLQRAADQLAEWSKDADMVPRPK